MVVLLLKNLADFILNMYNRVIVLLLQYVRFKTYISLFSEIDTDVIILKSMFLSAFLRTRSIANSLSLIDVLK